MAKKPRSAAQRANDERMKGKPFGGGHRKADGDGNPFANSSGGLSIRIPTHVEREFNKDRLGAIWQGYVMAGTRAAGADLTEYFPPANDAKELANWNRFADERALGEQLYYAVGPCFMHLQRTSGVRIDWSGILQRSVREYQGTSGVGVGMAGGGLQRPFDVATEITSPFGAARDGGLHRGVDLSAAPGTPVHAPSNARVDAVFQDEDGGGLCVRLALQRPDGGYAAETSVSDDSGLLVTFAHLQAAQVQPGQMVSRGDVVAASGASGRVTGPHLHVVAEYFNDAPVWSVDSNSRVFLDPTALYGGVPAITGQGEPQPFHPGDTMAAVVSPRGDGGASALSGLIPGANGGTNIPGTVTINNSGALTLNGGNAVNTPVKAVVDLGLIGGSQGDGGYSAPPVPDALRGVADQVVNRGGSILRGIGQLAGETFAKVVSPQGIQTIARLSLTAASGAGALAGILGPVVGIVGPFLAGIPYVGPFLAGAATVAAPIMTAAGPVVSAGAGGLLGVQQVMPMPGGLNGQQDAIFRVLSGQVPNRI